MNINFNKKKFVGGSEYEPDHNSTLEYDDYDESHHNGTGPEHEEHDNSPFNNLVSIDF